MKPPKRSLSRREFAKRAALGSAALAAAPATLVPDSLSPLATRLPRPGRGLSPLPSADSKLSPQSQAEAEARYQSILALYPDRFSDPQKTDLKRLCQVIQEPLDSLRAYAVSNSDQPALYLRPIVERAKATNAPPNLKQAPAKPSPAGKP